MGAGALIEPAVVVVLLFGGTWFNRNKEYSLWASSRAKRRSFSAKGNLATSRNSSPDSLNSTASSDTLLEEGYGSSRLLPDQEPRWRRREVRLLGVKREVVSPNTAVFRDYFLSRLLRKFPFLVEAWYWALIYWVYQLGRAFTAVTLVEGTVHVARNHALQLIHLEKALGLFFELPVQRFFMQYPTLMHWINRIYSFIHIPGTILFLVWLYFYTTTRHQYYDRSSRRQSSKALNTSRINTSPDTLTTQASGGPRLYESRRRTMAFCNLLAFIVFTIWPCMPPRLLSDPAYTGPAANEAKSFGFVDTVHGAEGESSVWTQNRFCNQYAAMPSLHFGYSFLIGLTIMSIPLSSRHRRSKTCSWGIRGRRVTVRLPSPRRTLCLALGVAYPLVILIAIIATANHFVLDAVAGAVVCGIAWNANGVLLSLLPVEDYFLWCVRIHKPVPGVREDLDGEELEGDE